MAEVVLTSRSIPFRYVLIARELAADGRFIMARARRTDGANGTTVVVAENWLTELKAKLKQ